MISYPIGHSGQVVVFADPVLAHFDRHRQIRVDSPEAGGQLFARFDGDIIRIEHASGPRSSDQRGPKVFIPNRIAERHEIRRVFKDGLHYVGDWHTHPEPTPSPSQIDIQSFREMYQNSRHGLASFLMVIVGTSSDENGIYVALCNENTPRRLSVRTTPLCREPHPRLDLAQAGAPTIVSLNSTQKHSNSS